MVCESECSIGVAFLWLSLHGLVISRTYTKLVLSDDVLFACNSVHVRYNIFLSAIEYLPFADEDETKGSFTEIIERLSLLLYCPLWF